MTNAEIINQYSFERLKSKNIRKTIIRRIFYVLITAVLCVLFAVICAALFFKIKTVEVTGNRAYTSDELIAASGVSELQNLYSVSSRRVESAIKNACPYIKAVKINRNLPSTLVIEVDEESAKYYIRLADEYYALSDSLRVLSRADGAEELTELNPGIKYIAIPEPKYCVVGDTLVFRRTVNSKFTSKLLAEIVLWDDYDKIDYIDFSDKFDIAIICYGGKYKLELGSNEDVKVKLDFAQAVIESSLAGDAANADKPALISVRTTDSVIVTFKDALFEDGA